MNDPLQQLSARADALQRQGRRLEAIAVYRQVLAQRPGSSSDWYNLGYVLRQEGRFAGALDAYGRALACGIERPEEVHLNRASILSDHLQRDGEAEAELRAALALAPDYVAARLNLGNLLEERGERDAAIASYEPILPSVDAVPDAQSGLRHVALARMAHLRPPNQRDDPFLDRLEQAARSAPDLDPEVRATLWFALGQACDRIGDQARAMQCFHAGNREALHGAPPYAAHRVEQGIDALIAAKSDLGASEGLLDPQPRPIFILGLFRSGSTLLERVLAAHPQVCAGGELEWFARLATRRLPQDASPAALAQDYLAHLRERFPQANAPGQSVTDKRPDNFLLVGMIKRLFPSALIVHTVRHPLDTGLSIYSQHLNPTRYPYAGELGDIGHYMLQYRRLMAHWQTQYEPSIATFDYDAFVRAPRATLEPLLGFLGLPWDDACLQFHRQPGMVRTASYWQVREPLHAGASGRWRRYATELEPLRKVLEVGGVAIPE